MREGTTVTPEISEFSYGFALTHELVGLIGRLRVAPIFPSLIEEGRAGGGYDVKLDAPGFPLFMQFKRSDCMVRSTASEIVRGLDLKIPFYRMKITERQRSAQHELLLQLDDGINDVFYAAPRFHSPDGLNTAWSTGSVTHRSIFVRPRDIGVLDDEQHHVAFDESHCYLCSDPKPVTGFSGSDLEEILFQRLTGDQRTLRGGVISEALERAERAVNRARSDHIEVPSIESLRDIGRTVPPFDAINQIDRQNTQERLPNRRAHRPQREPRSKEERELRELANIAIKAFGAQLFVIQDQ
jgi:hypothetical protein